MNVLAYDKFLEEATVKLEFMNNQSIDFNIKISKIDELLSKSDFISLHVPALQALQ